MSCSPHQSWSHSRRAQMYFSSDLDWLNSLQLKKCRWQYLSSLAQCLCRHWFLNFQCQGNLGNLGNSECYRPRTYHIGPWPLPEGIGSLNGLLSLKIKGCKCYWTCVNTHHGKSRARFCLWLYTTLLYRIYGFCRGGVSRCTFERRKMIRLDESWWSPSCYLGFQKFRYLFLG